MAHPTTIYHIAVRSDWEAQVQTKGHYFAPTYEQEGFIHATAEADVLINVANHFYKSSTDEWICLQLDTTRLSSEVKFEAPAPVGNTAPPAEGHGEVKLFPHIYGPITTESVVAVLPVHRAEDGTFLRIGA